MPIVSAWPANSLSLDLAKYLFRVPELEALLPALGVVLPTGSRLEGGTATVMLAMQGPADKLITTGSLALNNTKLTGFDLPKKNGKYRKAGGNEEWT